MDNSDLNSIDPQESSFNLRQGALPSSLFCARRFPITRIVHLYLIAHRGDRSSLGPRKVVATRMAAQGLLLDFKSARLYSPKHLVFGKAVKVRHYPVTVSTENRAGKFQPLAALLPGRRSSSLEV